MLGFDEPSYREVVTGAGALRGRIEEIAQEVTDKGYSRIYFIGSGGSYAVMFPYDDLFKQHSTVPSVCSIAAELVLTGNATISVGSSAGVAGSADTVDLTGDFDLGGNTLFVRGLGEGTISGDISGTGGLTKIDKPSTWILSGTNTYAGVTTVNEASSTTVIFI